MRQNRVENTERTSHENPLRTLVETGFGGGIEAQERRGQAQLLESASLPTDCRDVDAMIALGFTFGEPFADDPLFRPATLPTGWKREGSDHAMWSYIVDERGIRRVAVFYKAAFYDRRAHMGMVDVGRGAASDAIYGDWPITREALRVDLLTESERADFDAEVERMRKNIAGEQYNEWKIYTKNAPRLAAIDAVLAEGSSV